MEPSEQETTMTWDSEQKVVRIFSARRADQGKLKRAGILPVKEAESGNFYEVPLSRLRWRITTGLPSNRGIHLRKSQYSATSEHRRGNPNGDAEPGRGNN
jgi:hypothetical protein